MKKNKYQLSPEYLNYKESEIWEPLNKIVPASQLFPETHPLFLCLYRKIKEEYNQFPLRKNGEDPFLHPLNTVNFLIKAKVDDPITLCAGLLHDFVEENVDLYEKKHHLKNDAAGIKILDQYEEKVFKRLEEDLRTFCQKEKINLTFVKKVVNVTKILTRHKKHLYYRSISEIFNCKNEKTKERAIQIKLADRMHNIQTLSSYNEENRIYQCFKNLFILNNTKRYLLNITEKKKRKQLYSTTKLFKKCCKSTYESFLNVCHLSLMHKVGRIKSMLHLAFRKYASEYGGLWAVTKVNLDEKHLMRLFQGIIRKYDSRLHLEFDRFKKMENYEIDFCRKYFADFNFNQKQLQSLVYYKDAYTLKEIVLRLLYKPKYVIFRFGCTELCVRGRICMRERIK
ncbi:MAG: hypothetical protein KJ597_05770 [Nanoarchaeota archaeon]|nr:hypothetical protein [Nanoarchaeota archaeon]MBU1623053.1 hypothetical protein [Nanoarchaeota archaeon]